MSKKGIERLEGYKFFEMYSPYYALIKAKTDDEAIGLYIKHVAGDESEIDLYREDIKEVDEFTAIGKYYTSFFVDKDVDETLTEYFEYLLNEDSNVILIDGSLV